jgi:hypothetical protein
MLFDTVYIISTAVTLVLFNLSETDRPAAHIFH